VAEFSIKSPCSIEKQVIIYRELEIMKVKVIEEENFLQERLARSQAWLDAMPDLMFILDKNGIYLDYKAESDGDLYRAPNDFLGSVLTKFCHPIWPAFQFAI